MGDQLRPSPRRCRTGSWRGPWAAGACAVLLVVVVGCGADGPTEGERADLVDSLGFLAADFGLTEAQVACVADEIEAGTGGEALDGLAASLRAVDAGETTLAELPADEGRAVTGAIEACAVGAG